MKIQWLGVASFLITTEKGVRIIVDPYKAAGRLNPRNIRTGGHRDNQPCTQRPQLCC